MWAVAGDRVDFYHSGWVRAVVAGHDFLTLRQEHGRRSSSGGGARPFPRGRRGFCCSGSPKGGDSLLGGAHAISSQTCAFLIPPRIPSLAAAYLERVAPLGGPLAYTSALLMPKTAYVVTVIILGLLLRSGMILALHIYHPINPHNDNVMLVLFFHQFY